MILGLMKNNVRGKGGEMSGVGMVAQSVVVTSGTANPAVPSLCS